MGRHHYLQRVLQKGFLSFKGSPSFIARGTHQLLRVLVQASMSCVSAREVTLHGTGQPIFEGNGEFIGVDVTKIFILSVLINDWAMPQHMLKSKVSKLLE